MKNFNSKLKILTIPFLFFAGFFGLVGRSQAADCTHYVSPTGSATWVNSTNINTPTDVQTSFNNAGAGNMVCFRGGTYNVPAKNFSNTYHGYYEPVNSGTLTDPITFAAYTGETPIFNGTAGGSGDSKYYATIFGTSDKNYIVFDGFSFQANSGVNMARLFIGNDGSSNNNHIIVKNCNINGGSVSIPVEDNHEPIRIERVDDVTIQNNIVYNARCSNGCLDITGIKAYHANRVIVENNEFYNCEQAIYLKSDTDSWIIRYNFLHNNRNGIAITPYTSGVPRNADNHVIHDNLIISSTSASITIWTSCNTTWDCHSNNLQVYNNTIYPASGSIGMWLAGSGTNLKVWNNITQGAAGKQLALGYGDHYTLSEADYNQWGTSVLSIETHLYGSNHKVYKSLASWQESTELSGGLHPGTGDLASNPLFQNDSGDMNQLNDFRLRADSPCQGTGKDGVDMGADIDLVGVNTGQTQPFCGDGSCNGTETCSSCSSDCGTCIDITPPSISNGSPNGALASGTTQITMSVTTNEDATCRYSTTAGIEYSSMPNTFSATGGASHSATITGLSNGQTYNRYVRCQNSDGYANTSDYIITFSIASSEGTTITLYPTQDTYIDLNTSVNVSGTNLNTYTWPANQIANAILMKFNLSSIPSNANIQDAKLYLYLTEADTNASYPTYTSTLHRIINHNPNLSLATGYTYDGSNSWTANTLCYNNIPMAQSDISSAYDTQQINKTLGFKSWDATQLIRDWLSNSSANYGLLINSDATKPADTYRTYASSEYATTSFRPYLEIAYTLSSDTTPPAAPTGLVVN